MSALARVEALGAVETGRPVVACVDQSAFAHGVCDHAAWAAERLGAPIEVLHVTSEIWPEARRRWPAAPSGRWPSGLHPAAVTAAERLWDGGALVSAVASPDGGFVERAAEASAGSDLVVLGRRGAHSHRAIPGWGSHVERLVRASVAPLLVSSRMFLPVERAMVVACAAPIPRYEAFLAASPLLDGLALQRLEAPMARAGLAQSSALSQVDLVVAPREAVRTPQLWRGPGLKSLLRVGVPLLIA